jgi:ribonuclease P protein component
MTKRLPFSRTEIRNFFSSARCILKTTELTFLTAPSPHSHGRLLVVTPRAVGTAPQRNKIRRRLKALFYENNLLAGQQDYAIIVRQKATQLSFSELSSMILTALKAYNARTQKNNL